MKSAEPLLPHAWLVPVLEDLIVYAETNGLAQTAGVVKEALPTARKETSAGGMYAARLAR